MSWPSGENGPVTIRSEKPLFADVCDIEHAEAVCPCGCVEIFTAQLNRICGAAAFAVMLVRYLQFAVMREMRFVIIRVGVFVEITSDYLPAARPTLSLERLQSRFRLWQPKRFGP